jgi:hypothetical protein
MHENADNARFKPLHLWMEKVPNFPILISFSTKPVFFERIMVIPKHIALLVRLYRFKKKIRLFQ